MELTVGTDLSPGPDALSPARIASLATSPAGVLELLETALGLRAPLPSETERITALLPTLRTTPGYWSRSLTANEWGTARRLLRDLAALTLEGWAGQPISQRWDALWQVTRGTGPTEGERWQAVATALTDRPNTSLRTLNPLDPLPTWPGSIRHAFERLAATGTNFRDWTPVRPPPPRHLAAVHQDRSEPTGDASLQLIPHRSLAGRERRRRPARGPHLAQRRHPPGPLAPHPSSSQPSSPASSVGIADNAGTSPVHDCTSATTAATRLHDTS